MGRFKFMTHGFILLQKIFGLFFYHSYGFNTFRLNTSSFKLSLVIQPSVCSGKLVFILHRSHLNSKNVSVGVEMNKCRLSLFIFAPGRDSLNRFRDSFRAAVQSVSVVLNFVSPQYLHLKKWKIPLLGALRAKLCSIFKSDIACK